MDRCLHIKECKQKIPQNTFKTLCLGEVSKWDQEDCFKYNDVGQEDFSAVEEAGISALKTPKEWDKP